MRHDLGDLADTEQNDIQVAPPSMLTPGILALPSGDGHARIPVARPSLPRTDLLVPYLRQIDETQIYANHGPLVDQFEARMAARLGLQRSEVISCNSGTMALVGLIRATRSLWNHPGRLCLLPAYTFVATAGAVMSCGYECHLVDIDPVSWAMEPAALRSHPRLSEVGLVVPVAPYGRMIDLQGWQDFQSETGIPVVVDAAACLDQLMRDSSCVPEAVPLALSLHATKSFGSGEGGLVLSCNSTLVKETYKVLNNGFFGSRDAQTVGLNGKMSEYTAVVALAELDGFADKLARWAKVAEAYAAAPPAAGVRLWTAPDVSACYALAEVGSAGHAADLRARLTDRGIDVRNWYGAGLPAHPAYAHLWKDRLTISNDIASRIIGLPCFTDLTDADISRITSELR